LINEKTIMITGATSYVGESLIKILLNESRCNIIALSRDKSRLLAKYGNNQRILCFSNDDIIENRAFEYSVDIIVHLAFARLLKPESEIVTSIYFAKKIFNFAKHNNVKAVVNISSQSVYGNHIPGIKKEDSEICPENIYALGKYTNEIIMDIILGNVEDMVTTNVRVDSIAGNKNLLPSMVRSAINDMKINIVGGKQEFSLNDVRDVSYGLYKLLELDCRQWKKHYNLGNDKKVYSILQLANIVKDKVQVKCNKKVDISIEPKDIRLFAGIDSSLIIKDTGWKPLCSIYDIVDHIIDEYLHGGAKSESY